MTKPISAKFAVQSEDEAAAITYLLERGYSPLRVEKSDDDLSILVFAPLADDLMLGLVEALPLHLSAKIGIVMGNHPPFDPEQAMGADGLS